MKIFTLIIMILSLLIGEAYSQQIFLYPTIPSAANVLNFNIISSFGAACNGITDDAPAFGAAGAAIAANPSAQSGTPVVLTIPVGANCTLNSCVTGTSGRPVFYGIPNLTISEYGATVTMNSGACGQWAGQGVTATGSFPPAISALFTTVSSGASCVTMVTPGQESQFPVGSWAIASNINLQVGGYPQNNQVYEFFKVASEGSGQVCFTTNLANNYSSAYPDYGLDSPSGPCSGSCGGPATLFGLYSGWNTVFSILGGTWNDVSGPVEVEFIGNHVTLTDFSMPSAHGCYTPSSSLLIDLNNVSIPNCQVVVDKFMGTMNINGGVFTQFVFESPAPNVLNINSGAVITTLNGQGPITNCNNSTITTLVGARDYGANTSFNGNNCNIGSVSAAFFRTVVNSGGWTISSGVFTHAVAAQAISWPVPVSAVAGASYFFTGQFPYEYFPFTVTSLSQSLPNMSIATTLPGGLPTVPTQSGNLYVAQEPYPDWNCSNCYGSNSAVDFSQTGAQGTKLFTYSNRIYTCTNNIAAVQASNPGIPVIDLNSPPAGEPTIWGLLTSLTINVTVADTSGNVTLPWQIGGTFNNFQVIDTTTGNAVSFGPIVSLKTTGTRTITPTTVTGTQTGDTLSAPGLISSTGASVPHLGTNISGDPAGTCPVVTLTWQTSR